jgi:hypothetical protein
MSFPRYPRRELGLERLGDRDGLRRAHLAEVAQIASAVAGVSIDRETLAAYEALIDAVFTAPGAAEWLFALRLAVAKILADMDAARRAPHPQVARDAIRAARPGLGGF